MDITASERSWLRMVLLIASRSKPSRGKKGGTILPHPPRTNQAGAGQNSCGEGYEYAEGIVVLGVGRLRANGHIRDTFLGSSPCEYRNRYKK